MKIGIILFFFLRMIWDYHLGEAPQVLDSLVCDFQEGAGALERGMGSDTAQALKKMLWQVAVFTLVLSANMTSRRPMRGMRWSTKWWGD